MLAHPVCLIGDSQSALAHKGSDKSCSQRDWIPFVKLSRCQVCFWASSDFFLASSLEAGSSLSKDKRLACDHTAQEIAEQT